MLVLFLLMIKTLLLTTNFQSCLAINEEESTVSHQVFSQINLTHNLFFITNLFMYIFIKSSLIQLSSKTGRLQLESFALYNNKLATWTLLLKIKIPEKTKQMDLEPVVLFRVNLIYINEFSNSSTRFIYTEVKFHSENRLVRL